MTEEYSAVRKITNGKALSSHMFRWSLKLEEYMNIDHIPSKENSVLMLLLVTHKTV